MSSTDSHDCEHTAGDPTGIARCASLDGSQAPFTVHGVAIGEGDVTMGQHGPKFWPASALRRATQTLVGVPLTKNHDDEHVESVIGEVVDAGYEDGVGIVYEAEVDDRALAQKIVRGRLEVSVHAVHADGGRTNDGEMRVENIRFLDLSVVPRGAAPSNTLASGESQSEAIASLSTDEVATMLADSADSTSDPAHDDALSGQSSPDASAHENDSTMTTTDTETPDEAPEAEAEASHDEPTEAVEEAEIGSEEAVNAEANATEDAELEEEPDVEAEEAEASEEPAEGDADEEAELREEITELRAENEELRHELEDVRMEYAERLADDGPFTAAELAENFSFDSLKDKFESHEASLAQTSDDVETATADAPAPRTGDVSAEEELSTSPNEDADEIASLEAKVEKYDDLGWDNAKAEAEAELSALRE